MKAWDERKWYQNYYVNWWLSRNCHTLQQFSLNYFMTRVNKARVHHGDQSIWSFLFALHFNSRLMYIPGDEISESLKKLISSAVNSFEFKMMNANKNDTKRISICTCTNLTAYNKVIMWSIWYSLNQTEEKKTLWPKDLKFVLSFPCAISGCSFMRMTFSIR